MLVHSLEDRYIESIGHAFGYYDYGEEKVLSPPLKTATGPPSTSAALPAPCCKLAFFPPQVPAMRASSPTSSPARKIRPSAFLPPASGRVPLHDARRAPALCPRDETGRRDPSRPIRQAESAVYFCRHALRSGGIPASGLHAKAPSQEGERLGVPVILETDAMSKCEKIPASWHGACRDARCWRIWEAVRSHPLSGKASF